MGVWRLLALAFKLRRGWKRIPPAQRKKILKSAGKHARRHGPTVARRIGAAVRKAR
jgi:acyl-CoA reductase-like NAD-dependent aldehyde dehydrogenase